MRNKKLAIIFTLVTAFSFSGCASKFVELLAETDKAIGDAAIAGAEKNCPKELREVRQLREKAKDTFWTCNSEGAKKMAKEATEKAKALCPKKAGAVVPSAPGKDRDGDGIPDDMDGCPDKAEDKDGYLDKDGCPDPDNDYDGFLDANDKCPNEPEDKDGFQDDDGCPDPDNDGDGILDTQDKCPNEPETVNGYQDDDGCPDRLPERFILEGVHFATNSAKLDKASTETLKTVAKILAKNPALTIRIEGHTDNQGSDAYNQTLSLRRANAVKDYLVSQHKINASRLSTAGFGKSRPIASNDTEAGRAKNRRIEFVITGGNPGGNVRVRP